MRITDIGRKYRPVSRVRCCKVTFRSHHIAQHGMRSTATHAAWSVYVSVCCRVTSVSYAKNDWIDGDAVWVWTHAPQWTVAVLDGSRISHAREKVLLGKFWYLGKLRLASGRYSQPYLQSGSSDVASGTCLFCCFRGTVHRAVLVACNLE